MYTVGIIGLGSIAQGYGTPEQKTPYCHVGGIRFSDRVRLVGVADLSPTVREAFRARWGAALPEDLRYYESSAALLCAGVPDIVAVCVRGPHHYAVMQEVIEAGPKAIFLEKPASCSLEEMDLMVAAAQAKRIPITVSYSRHWAPHVLRLQELVQGGLIGQVQKVVGYNGGHILSFAIHTTDLICQFAGYCPKTVYAQGRVEGEAPAGYEPEPQLDAMIVEFENGVTGIQVGADGGSGQFYVDVFGSEGSVRAGMYIPPLVKGKDGKPLPPETLGMPEDASVFTVAYGQIADYLDGGPLPHCTNEAWMAVNELGFAAIESLLSRQRVNLPSTNRTRKIYANG